MDQLLEQLAIAAAAMTPDVHQQAIGVHHLSGIGQQQLQQPRLERRDFDLAIGDAQRQQIQIERQLAGLGLAAACRGRRVAAAP